MKVIYVMADTFRRDHLGVYGNPWIHTPNLDRFAHRAAAFDNAYIGSFPTVPNRRDTLLGTGDQGFPFNRWKPLEANEVTLGERLAEKGVVSMLVTDTQNNVTGGRNIAKGFTAWAFNRGQEADPMWLDPDVPLEFPVPPHLIRYTAQWWHQILMNRAQRKVETDWFAPGTYSMAIQWLETNYTRDDFFLWIDTFDPHEPWDPPQHYIDLYDPGYTGRVFEAPTYGLRREMGITAREVRHMRARYAGEVTMVDTWFGRLLETLDRLGIADETTVVFTSDHGTLLDTPGDNGFICKSPTVGADGMCMSAGRPLKQPQRHFPIYENTARIPLMVRTPDMKRGTRVKTIAQPWDMSATILEAFGIDKPDAFIGQSLMPALRGEKQRIRDAAVCGTNALAQAINDRWIYTVWRGQRGPSLIDLRENPRATKNVVSQHPAVARRLHKRVTDFMRRQGIPEAFVDGYA